MADSGAVHDPEAEAPGGQGGLTAHVLRAGDALEEWNRFVDSSPQGSIFCRPWWLEAVAPGQFEVLTLRRGGRIVAGMPLVRYRRWGFQAIHMPQLTQTLGPLLGPPAAERYERRLSNEMELLSALIAAMPSVSHTSFFCHPSLTNWLPFYWAGYEQTTRYTYAIEDLSDPERVFASFAHSKRKNIKKAERLVEVREDMEPRAFYGHHAASLRKQGDAIFYSYELFERIHRAATARGAGKTWLAVDPAGNVHSAIFVVFDPASAYYLISTIDPEFRASDSATLLVKRAIEYVAPHTKRFDFEGSMVRSVEASFRKFGAVQTPYFHIHRNDLPLPARLALAIGHEVSRTFRRRGP
ncbi:MAG: GNAT family N-acetyltransferase [Planctomycetes bacterium]|nr:GNAT family N-acetyltransferase [Planctomycetota bacterium]